MNTRLLIIIGISVVITISLLSYAIYDSSTTVFIDCDPRYTQIDGKCVLLKPEQYCTDWCDQKELSNLGCNQLILDHIYRTTNLFDEDFDGGYIQNFVGLPDGVSKEKFEQCVDIIYDKRSSFIISGLHNLDPTERDEFITKYSNIVYNGEFHSQVYITNLQNEYAIDEPITFTAVTWGYGHPCQSPSFVYYYETKDSANIVFEDKFIRLCQVLDESDYTNYYQELDSIRTDKAQNQNIYPVFDKLGNYIVSVDDRTEYSFSIIESESEPEDVLGIAQEFIKSSPTFAFDGIEDTLSLELVFIRESFPEQYVIEAEFSTLHGGYGDRTDQMVTQAITPHKMNLVVISGQVTSAIIDGKWDELNHIELPWTPTTDPNETVSHVNKVVDYVSLIDNLRANDTTVNPEGEIEQPFFSVTGFSIQVNGSSVQVFEYDRAEDAEADTLLVSPDGSSIGTSMPFWVDDPHFYYKEKIIVLYVGDDPAIEELLESVLGSQFAGR